MAREERSAGIVLYCRAPSSEVDGAVAIEYLLLDHGKHWDFAKGHVKKGEDDLAAAIRELGEETGIDDARVISGFEYEIHYQFRTRKKKLVRKTVIFFLAEAFGRDVELSDEHVGFEFLPYERAIERVTYATAKAVLKAAHTRLIAGRATA